MAKRIVMALVVGVLVFLFCKLLGIIANELEVSFIVAIGGFFDRYAAVIGLLATILNYVTGWPRLTRT